MDLTVLPSLAKEAVGLAALVFIGWIVYLFAKPIIAKLQNGSAAKDKRDSDLIATLIQGSREESREIAKHMSTTTSVLGTIGGAVNDLAASIHEMRKDLTVAVTREEERHRIRTQQWDSIQIALNKLAERRHDEQLRESAVRKVERDRKKPVKEVLV